MFFCFPRLSLRLCASAVGMSRALGLSGSGVVWVFLILVGFGTRPLSAAPPGVWFLDLSKAANRGFADTTADDGLGGWTDQGREGDLHDFPVGERDLLGVPFRILDPAQNGGRSAVLLRGRRRPTWPESVSLPVDGWKASWLYFLHTCAWAGTDKTRPFAQYEIQYGDGTKETIPLRVGVETAGWWGPGQGDHCRVVWTAKRKAASVGVQVFAWKNPHPEKQIASVVFRSLNRMPIPILLAITASAQPLTLKAPTEEAVKPEGVLWPLVGETALGNPPVDVPKILASTRKPPPSTKKKPLSDRIRIQQGHFVDPSGRRVRFMGASIPEVLQNAPADERERTVSWLSACGFNLIRLSWDGSEEARFQASYDTWRELAATHHMFLQLAVNAPLEPFTSTSPASVWGTFWTAPRTNGLAPKDDPVLALVSVAVESKEKAEQEQQTLVRAGVSTPLSAEPTGNETEGPALARSLDFSSGVFAWDEPQMDSDGIGRFSDQALLTTPDSGLMAKMSTCRDAGKPFIAQVGEGWPNAYSCEGPILQAVMGSFQDWDGLMVRTVWGRWGQKEPAMNPASSLWPAAALLFLRGDVAVAKQSGNVGDAMEDSGESAASNLGWWAHRLSAGKGTLRVPVAKVDPKLKKVVADNGRWEWQGNIGLFKVGSAKTQVLAGYLSHRPLANYAWDVQSPNPFVVLTLTSLTEDGTALSRRLLVTAAGRYEYEGASFNAARSALLSEGRGGLLMEPLKAKVMVLRSKVDPGMTAQPFDLAGHRMKKKIKLTWKGKNVSFVWPEGATWVLMESGRP